MAGKTKYAEGDWFAVPLRPDGYAVGLVARVNPKGVLLGYFFGPKRATVPEVDELTALDRHSALLVKRFGHLGVRNGDWPIIGQCPGWRRDERPMPAFIRKESLTPRALRVSYDPDDPNREVSAEVVAEDSSGPEDGMAGAQWIEIRLSRLLDHDSAAGDDEGTDQRRT